MRRIDTSTILLESVLAYDAGKSRESAVKANALDGWGRLLYDLLGCKEFLTFTEQKCQFFAGLGIMFIGLYLNCVIQANLQNRFEHPCFLPDETCRVWTDKLSCEAHNCTWQRTLALPDLGFHTLPDLSHSPVASWLADWWCEVTMVATLVRFVIITGPVSLRWTILRRWCTCMGVLFLLRAISIATTVLPNPATYCEATIRQSNPWLEAVNLILQRDVTCTDVLYSGHTVNITLCCLVWIEYAPRTPLFPRRTCGPCGITIALAGSCDRPAIATLAVVWAGCGYLIIIMTHFHYSVDVWIGFWMTTLVWRGYHSAVRIAPFYAHNNASKFLLRFIAWLEAIAPDLFVWHERQRHLIRFDNEVRNALSERGLLEVGPSHGCS